MPGENVSESSRQPVSGETPPVCRRQRSGGWRGGLKNKEFLYSSGMGRSLKALNKN
jgi:hypothetical protein